MKVAKRLQKGCKRLQNYFQFATLIGLQVYRPTEIARLQTGNGRLQTDFEFATFFATVENQ